MVVLGSCGGGGGGGGCTPIPTPTPTPIPTNQPPSFTSPTAAAVTENSAGTIYTATATDPEGGALTFSLAGGPDQARFALTSAGALSFVTAPDFETPTDADADNVYLITIAVTDGQTSTTLNVTVTVTNAGPDAFRVTRVAAGFVEPMFVTTAPGNPGGTLTPGFPLRIFVIERRGNIYILEPATGARTLYLNLTSIVSTAGEGGLLGFAMSPNYAQDGWIFVYLTNAAGDIELRRYRSLSGNRDFGQFSTGDVILTIPHPGFTNHYGGWIGFGPDNFLYVATGDGGGSGDPGNNAQNTNSLLGKILRLDVSVRVGSSDTTIIDDFPNDPLRDYVIPPSNPFAAGGGRPEIWAYGLRNPFRASFDSITGNLWIGDVGQDAREEIDVIRPGDGGANFGWRVFEGTQLLSGPAITGTVPPVAEYLHGTGARQGNSVTGGRVYRGPIEAFQGQYFFADFVRSNIWSVSISRLNQGATLSSDQFVLRNADLAPNAGTIDNVVCFGVDKDNNLYIVDLDGEIFRIEPA